MSCFSAKVTTANMAEPNPTKHVNYNLGMVLGVDDFTQQFAYHSGRDQGMVRDLIGYGTVRGLKIGLEVDVEKGARIAVEPGVAVSPRGQMICVPAAQCAYLKDWIEQHSDEISETSPPPDVVRLYVVLCYRDCPTDNVPIAGEPCRSEDQLVAASRLTDDFCLELRLKAPNQREEDAVRDYVAWLKQIPVGGEGLSSTPDEFLDAIRAAAQEWLASPLSSPPGDFMVGVPPAFLHIHPADACDYMRAAFRLWITELRPKWIARWHGCAATHFETDDQTEEDCVMLAELTVPVIPSSPGNWTLAGEPEVQVDESRRPCVIHLRMLQEWLLCGCACSGGAIGPPILEDAVADVATITRVANITNIVGDANLSLSSEQQIIVCDSTNGAIVLDLPAAVENVGHVFIVKHISPGTHGVTITADGSDRIDGKPSAAMTAPLKFIELVANVVGEKGVWHIIGRN